MSDFHVPTTSVGYICEAIDFNATHNPNHHFHTYADEHAAGGITFITHAQFAKAAHRAAYLIRPDLTSPQGEVVAIISNSDAVTYHAIVAGTMLAGLVPFPISPRNSPAAILDLLQKTDCHKMLTTKHTLQPLLDGVVAQISTSDPSFIVQINESPTLLQVYPQLDPDSDGSQEQDVRYPWWNYRPDMDSPFLYLHSSGSTGFPKPVAWSHRIPSIWATMSFVRDCKSPNVLSAMSFPPFHTLGFVVQLLIPTFGGATIALFPPLVFQSGQFPMLPSADYVLEHTMRTKSNQMIVIPSFLQAWLQDPAAIESLRGLDEVYSSGGILATKLGDTLVNSGVNVHIVYGSTELGPSSTLDPRPRCEKDWEYVIFDPRAKMRFIPHGHRTYEAQVLKTDTHGPTVLNMPDGYATSDLFEEHPTKKGFYKMVGRLDDVIIHSSGEKTVPGPIENIITGDVRVETVVLFGHSQKLVGALIELRSSYQVDPMDDSAMNNMKAEIWPTIANANRIAPAFSRIYKDMIIFTPPDKPFPRAGKGTVLRKAAVQLFDDEINALYNSIGKTVNVHAPSSWDKAALTSWVTEQLEDLYPETKYDMTTDLFEQGMDSIGVTFVRQRIASAFRQFDEPRFTSAAEKMKDSQIYAHPTVDGLVQYVLSLLSDEGRESSLADARQEIQDMITKFSADLAAPPKARTQLQGPIVVLLTGSTGNLGAHTLSELLQDQDVARVYALNRRSSTPSRMRQEKMFNSHGLDLALLNLKKLVFLEGDAGQDSFGLDPAHYEELRTLVNVIIHNAWRLDFNLGLSSFQSNVRGTWNLIQLGLTGTHHTSLRFIFTSSIGSAQSWPRSRGRFPEEPVDDPSVAVGPGYGASKYVSERILVESGLQFCSLRIGQLSGGYPNGAWAATDWLPIMVKSSLHLGVLPSSLGVVSWVPMNIVARTIRDLILLKHEAPRTINMVHPHPVPWNDVIGFINEALVKQGIIQQQLPVIGFSEWVHRVEEHAVAPTDEVLKAMPAIKLEKYFKSMADAEYVNPVEDETGTITRFWTGKSEEISATFRELERIQRVDAERWVKYWASVGTM